MFAKYDNFTLKKCLPVIHTPPHPFVTDSTRRGMQTEAVIEKGMTAKIVAEKGKEC